MDKAQVRLELVKLCYSHLGAEEAVAKAKIFEAYVFEEAKIELAPAAPVEILIPEEKSKGKGKTSKAAAGNPNPLD